MKRTVVTALAVLALTAAAAPAEARPTRTLAPTCRAEVRIFEDGTWMGASIYTAHGVRLAPRWDVTRPELRGTVQTDNGPVYNTEFPPTVNGQTCTVTIAARS